MVLSRRYGGWIAVIVGLLFGELAGSRQSARRSIAAGGA